MLVAGFNFLFFSYGSHQNNNQPMEPMASGHGFCQFVADMRQAGVPNSPLVPLALHRP